MTDIDTDALLERIRKGPAPRNSIRLLVTGGRYFNDVPRLWRYLDSLEDVQMVVEGASDDVTGPHVGTDYWANQWARARGIYHERYHAEWEMLGKAAGPIRNKKMIINSAANLVVAAPGNAGTKGMIAIAKERGVEVRMLP